MTFKTINDLHYVSFDGTVYVFDSMEQAWNFMCLANKR